MSGDGRENESEPVTARIPGALWDQMRTLFREERGYEPSTPQEALGVLCDLAEEGRSATTDSTRQSLDSATPTDEQHSPEATHDSGTVSTASPPSAEAPLAETTTVDSDPEPTADPAAAIGTAPQHVIDAVDATFPDSWDDEPYAARFLPAVVDEYADAVAAEVTEPKQAAIETVADRSDKAPERLYDRLVAAIYRDEPLLDETASEFFEEALDVAERRVRDQSSEADELDIAELAEHGGLSPTTTFDGSPMEPPTELAAHDEVSFDELVDDLDATSDPIVPEGANVESLLDTSHADSRVREVAGEVLEEMTGSMFDQLENGVDQGTGTGLADGQGGTTTASTEPSTEAKRTDADDRTEVDDDSDTASETIPGPLQADPKTNCDECGVEHRVSQLETTLSDEDGTAVLLCPDCR